MQNILLLTNQDDVKGIKLKGPKFFCSKDSNWAPHEKTKPVSQNFSFSKAFGLQSSKIVCPSSQPLC